MTIIIIIMIKIIIIIGLSSLGWLMGELLIPKKCSIGNTKYIASDSQVQFLTFTRRSCFH